MNKIQSLNEIRENPIPATEKPATPATVFSLEPEPLPDRSKAAPYPIEYFPEKIKSAIIEAQEEIQAPLPIIAASALAAMSLAIQSKVDVQRKETLQSPVSLYSLIIAESGDRKSSADKAFTDAIRSYQREVVETNKPIMNEYNCNKRAWHAERDGIERAIKQAAGARQKDKVDELKKDLQEISAQEPKKPINPDYLFENFSNERVKKDFTEWPSAGLFSAEGGAVFGSYGMKKDSIMDTLATFNALWSGESISFKRATTDSGTLHNCRLTISLAIQQGALSEFLDQSGGLARSSGFWARCLITSPESLQGYRLIDENSFFKARKLQSVDSFNADIRAILEKPDRYDDAGFLKPDVMTLSAGARRAWVKYFNKTESELRPQGDLIDVRDFASKSAEMAVRIAALMEYFCTGNLEITENRMISGAILAGWYLEEAQRYFNLIERPETEVDAEILEPWLIEKAQKQPVADVAGLSVATLEKHFVMQYGPYRIRKPGRLDAALEFLTERKRLMITEEQRGKKIITLNPKILGATDELFQ